MARDRRRSPAHLDDLIVHTIPDVHRAVKWNTPFYGLEGEGWFLAFHCYSRYVKVTFFRGTSLKPVPRGRSKTPDTRYLDIYENADLDKELGARRQTVRPGRR